MKSAAVSQVADIIARALGVPADRVREQDSIETIPEWDSLGHLNILSALDKTFAGEAAKIPELAKATSVAAIVAALQRHQVLRA